MRYRLGSFTPSPGSHDFEVLLASDEFGARMTGALEEMLRIRLSRAPRGPLPDLLETLDARHPDRPWAEEVRDRLEGLHRDGLELRLLACEHEDGPDGFLTIAATAPSVRLEILPRDWMQVGFAAMREGEGVVQAWPRLLRQVCANGSIVCIEELERHEGAAGIGEAVGRFLEPALYEPAVHALREARATAVPDPREFFDELRRIGGLTTTMLEYMATVVNNFEDGEDDSLYGLVNAVTATARDVDDWPDRLDLEEQAGRLALLRRPVPRRTGGATLVPV